MEKNNSNFFDNQKICLILGGIFLVYLMLSSAAINEKLSTPGEMYVLYVADRIRDGLIPYQDIAIVYGPLVYIFNASLLSLGFSYSDLKLIMLIVSISNGLLIYFASKRLFRQNSLSILSVAIYMFVPMHYGHGPIVHPDQLAVLQILLVLNLILLDRKSSLFIGGIVGSILYVTKIVSIPSSLAPIIYFIINRQKKGVYYVIPLIVSSSLTYAYILSIRKLDFTKFFFDYITTFPDEPYSMLRSYFWIEGFVVLLAFLGLIIYIRNYSARSILVIMSFVSIISFSSFMIRGSGIYSANYIEPFISILAAYFIFYIFNKVKKRHSVKIGNIICICLICTTFIQFTIFDYPHRERHADWQGDRWFKTLNENTVVHTKLIEQYTNEGDIVVAIPMAAFQTNRILALDKEPYPDILKFKKEYFSYESADIIILELKEMTESKKIKLIIGGNTTGTNNDRLVTELTFYYPFNLPEFENAIKRNYDEYFNEGYYYYLPKSNDVLIYN